MKFESPDMQLPHTHTVLQLPVKNGFYRKRLEQCRSFLPLCCHNVTDELALTTCHLALRLLSRFMTRRTHNIEIQRQEIKEVTEYCCYITSSTVIQENNAPTGSIHSRWGGKKWQFTKQLFEECCQNMILLNHRKLGLTLGEDSRANHK